MKSHLGVLETQETQAVLLAGMEYLVSEGIVLCVVYIFVEMFFVAGREKGVRSPWRIVARLL